MVRVSRFLLLSVLILSACTTPSSAPGGTMAPPTTPDEASPLPTTSSGATLLPASPFPMPTVTEEKLPPPTGTPTPAPTGTADKLPAAAVFQNFEVDNGTSPGSGNYFWDAWFTTCSFSEPPLPVHTGRRAVRVEAYAKQRGNPQNDTGGTIGINPSSDGSIDLSSATTISVWVYDTQGNNTVELKLRDAQEQVSNGVWSDPTRSVKNQWTQITWNLADFPGVDMHRIKNIELYEWNDGIYFFDDVTYQ